MTDLDEVLPEAAYELRAAGYRPDTLAAAIAAAQRMFSCDYAAAVVFVTGRGDLVEIDRHDVDSAALLDGYRQAHERFQSAAQGRDARAVFRALFEVLNWCVSFDDHHREAAAPDGVPLDWAWREHTNIGELTGQLNAARYARNLVHHRWVDPLELQLREAIPHTDPRRVFSYVWRDPDELPTMEPVYERNSPDYSKHFAGKNARGTFAVLTRDLALVDARLP